MATRLLVAATALAGAALLGTAGCRNRPAAACARCSTAVVAAVSEPASIFPPLVQETVGRDVSDLVYQRLADLRPGAAPIDPSGYAPALARSWERVDSLTWRFHLRPGAVWQDGRPVTAADVVFSFDAFADSTLDTPARGALAGVTASAPDSATVLIRFPSPGPEQLYDATYHVRIIPRHIWDTIPRSAWPADTAAAHLVGSGPYRLASWQHGQSLTLAADSTGPGGPAIRRVVWRFTDDPETALNLILSHEADLLETVGGSAQADRVAGDSAYRLMSYPSAVYGFVGFHIADGQGRPLPLLGDREVRRALGMGVDRTALARGVFGPGTVVPDGPMSRVLWISGGSIEQLPYDTAAADRLLDQAGWRRGSDGTRRRGGRPLTVDVLVPSTSATRRRAAEVLQQDWRQRGVNVTITAVDFPVFQERLASGRFQAYIGAYLDEPTPRGLSDQWGRSGWDQLNFGHYADPAFDSLLSAAGGSVEPTRARQLYTEAFDTLAADAPAIFLYTLTNTAAIQRRLTNVTIDPFSWLATLPTWTIDSTRGLSGPAAR